MSESTQEFNSKVLDLLSSVKPEAQKLVEILSHDTSILRAAATNNNNHNNNNKPK